MIDAIVKDKIHWLNTFPPTYYIHPHTGPAGLMLGTGPINVKHLQLDFGKYCQVYKNTKNDMTFRSVGAIAIRPKNEMGSYYFMSLRIGRRIHSNQWTVLHVTDEVLQRVHDLADQDGVQDMKDGQIIFEWNLGMTIHDRHAYEIPMADGEVNNTDMQPIGNVGHDIIIFENEQDSEY